MGDTQENNPIKRRMSAPGISPELSMCRYKPERHGVASEHQATRESGITLVTHTAELMSIVKA